VQQPEIGSVAVCAVKIIQAGKNLPCASFILPNQYILWEDNLQKAVSGQTEAICNLSNLKSKMSFFQLKIFIFNITF
jgi:hypothetical protein